MTIKITQKELDDFRSGDQEVVEELACRYERTYYEIISILIEIIILDVKTGA